jgi:hypothetical protein
MSTPTEYNSASDYATMSFTGSGEYDGHTTLALYVDNGKVELRVEHNMEVLNFHAFPLAESHKLSQWLLAASEMVAKTAPAN